MCGKHLKGREYSGKEHTISAGEIEQLILEQVPIILNNETLMKEAFGEVNEFIYEILKGIVNIWESIFPIEKQNIVKLLIKRIWFKENGLKVEISNHGLKSLVKKYKATNELIEAKEKDIRPLSKLILPAQNCKFQLSD